MGYNFEMTAFNDAQQTTSPSKMEEMHLFDLTITKNILLPLQYTKEFLYTDEDTFNFWALEVTDLTESKLLLYFCRITWAQDRLSTIYKYPYSTSPVFQRLSLLSMLWTIAQ